MSNQEAETHFELHIRKLPQELVEVLTTLAREIAPQAEIQVTRTFESTHYLSLDTLRNYLLESVAETEKSKKGQLGVVTTLLNKILRHGLVEGDINHWHMERKIAEIILQARTVAEAEANIYLYKGEEPDSYSSRYLSGIKDKTFGYLQDGIRKWLVDEQEQLPFSNSGSEDYKS